MSIQPGNWYGMYYDANGWAGDVVITNLSLNGGQVTGDTIIYIRGTDLGWVGTISGTVSAGSVNLVITGEGAYSNIQVPLTGFFEEITSAWVHPTQAMYGFFSSFDVPSQYSNESEGGVWNLWPGGPVCRLYT